MCSSPLLSASAQKADGPVPPTGPPHATCCSSALSVARRANLSFGVRSLYLELPSEGRELLDLCAAKARESGQAEPGDRIAVVAAFGEQKTTNGVVVHTVE